VEAASAGEETAADTPMAITPALRRDRILRSRVRPEGRAEWLGGFVTICLSGFTVW
jgi:hypothetical protein